MNHDKWIVMSIIETFDGTNAEEVKQKLRCTNIRLNLQHKVQFYPCIKLFYPTIHVKLVSTHDAINFWVKKMLRGHTPFKNFKVLPHDKALIERFVSLGENSIIDIIRYIINTYYYVKRDSEKCALCGVFFTSEHLYISSLKFPNGTDKTITSYITVCETCVNKVYNTFISKT